MKFGVYFGKIPSLRGQYTSHRKHSHATNFHFCKKYSNDLCWRCHTLRHCTACRSTHPCMRCLPVYLCKSCSFPLDTMHFQVPNSCRRCPKEEGENINVYPGQYLGEGRVYFSRDLRDLYLECDFNDPRIHIVSNTVWQKIKGPYLYEDNTPHIQCPLCTVQIVNSDGYRYEVRSVGGKSILRVRDFVREDWGIYRCAATTRKTHSLNTETVFKIVVFL
ncbi:uncharacterized protein LOC143255406 [Tachypleus tridentatus]|uniref:uncharacterized protein LOC143255406 n=1 Tax=Tachypleus tridentatus TaxID=6853 RepID=UPI003FD1A849